MIRMGIIGASGYTGAELLRLCAGHPELTVALATGDSQAGTAVGDLYPSLVAAYPDLVFASPDPSQAEGLDLVVLGLPHGASQAVVPQLIGKVGAIVDLAADFRLKDASLYPTWYHDEHQRPDLLGQFAFGLPELFRDEIKQSRLVAAPGCHVTAASLAIAPLVRLGLIDPVGVVVDTITGVSGAGRAPKPTSSFCAVDEDVTAYGLLTHRHTPEIEQATGASVVFTPHLAPLNRGILATCYARPAPGRALSSAEVLEALATFYEGEPFIVVDERSPSTKACLGANTAHLTVRVDPRTGWVVAIAALDNLVKGASGQGLQCANLVLGLPETTGLPLVGMYP